MKTSKLIRNLQILTKEEMKHLLPFLKSPYYNSNSNIIKLYRVLLPQHPNFESRKLSNTFVFKKIYPDKRYAHQQLFNLMSEFNRLLERYLIIRQLEQEDLLQEKLLLSAYANHPDCYPTFVKKFEHMHNALDNSPFRDEMYYYDKMELNLLYYEHPDTLLQKDDKETLSNAIEHFGNYKKLTEVKLKCAQNARHNTIQEKQVISTQQKTSNPLLELYKSLETFQRSENLESFITLVDTFKECIQLLRVGDQRNILKILLNYCNRQMNSGQIDFFHTGLELYKLGLKYNCLLTYNIMKDTTFHNIVTAGAICQEFEWTKKFMNQYQEKLHLKEKADAIALAKGIWHFEKREYSEVIESLQYTFRNPKDIFKSKSLLIRSWFELWVTDDNYFDLLFAQLEAFEKFIRRDRTLTDKLSAAFLKFNSFTKKISLLRPDQKVVENLQQEISNESNLVFKRWLLEKVEDIK